MNIQKKSHRLIQIALLTSGLAISLASPANSHSQLKRISHKIASIKAVLHHDQKQKNQLQKQLENIELQSANAGLNWQQTHQKLQKQQRLLKKIQAQLLQYQVQLSASQSLLASEIRAAYMLGRQPYLKLLLDQQGANRSSRVIAYYQYISQNRANTIKNLQTTLNQVQANERNLMTQYQTLKQLQKKQQQEQNRLKSLKQSRHQLIQKIKSQIKTKRQKLAQLINNKERFETTIKRIEQSTRYSNLPHHFAVLRGKLPWPIKGKILNYFGTKIDESGLRWGGVLIKAPDGQAIHAIANGKVVFAKWLPSYGLLMIINHGNGYMTLYGRNHYLYKKVGDTVHAGDTIASVGKSGGYQNPALYFAIRHNGKPLNPMRWCHTRH